MTNEEAIDLLDNLIGMIEDNHDSDYDTALKMAIKALEYDDAKYHEEHREVVVDQAVWEDAKRSLEQEPINELTKAFTIGMAFGFGKKYDEMDIIMEAIKAIPSAEPKWIPVSERLPQINEWVLCQCRAGYKVLMLTSYGCYCNDTQEYMDSFVIAWMPLPTPYEPQESEDKE